MIDACESNFSNDGGKNEKTALPLHRLRPAGRVDQEREENEI